MDSELFTLISMAARYWFCGIMVLIVFRGLQITFADSKSARILRKWSPDAGCIGQFVVNPGRGGKKECLPIPREGTLGSCSRNDVCVKSRSVKRFHLSFEAREGGLLIKPRDKANVLLNDEFSADALFARDGDTVTIGDVKLLLVIFGDDGVIDIQNGDGQTDDMEEFEQNLWPDV